jgi:hypothetical protein
MGYGGPKLQFNPCNKWDTFMKADEILIATTAPSFTAERTIPPQRSNNMVRQWKRMRTR